ncbi:hypothetical protein Q9L58_006661 [Maublancomyces gigas]|uniref:CHAT domain-containing protein n=1 Tax=Discina gigas TaxID=1032678 RepID=A0ABR3GEX3_9PEZI
MTDCAGYFERLQALHDEFSLSGDPCYLTTATSLTEAMIATNPPDDYQAVLQLVLSGLIDGGSINIVLDYTEHGVLSPLFGDHCDRSGRLSTLSVLFHTRFQQAGVIDDLQKAIQLVEQAIAGTPHDHPNRAERLNGLGLYHSTRFEWLGDIDDLNIAIRANEQAVAATAPEPDILADILDDLSNQLHGRFELLGSLDDLESAVRAGEEAVAVAPLGHPERCGKLTTLGKVLHSRFQRLGAMEDLERAIELGEKALTETPAEDPGRVGRVNNLACYFSTRFDHLGESKDLQKAVLACEEAVECTAQDDPARGNRLCNLSNILHSRFLRLGDLDDIEKAIEASVEAVAVTPEESPDLAGALIVLSMMLNCRFGRLGAVEDLERAISASEEGVAATPMDDQDWFARADMLSNNYHTRFELLGSLEDLEKAIDAGEKALAAAPVDHPDRAIVLSNVGFYLSSRFQRLGALEDIDNAIQASRDVVVATPENHPDRAHRLSNLGQWLETRFGRNGSLEDLENAIQASEEGIAVAAPDHPGRVVGLSNLSNIFLSRFQRLGAMDDLEKAIGLNRDAVAAIAQDHPDRVAMLSNLGIKLHRKFERSGALDDLEHAIEATKEAVASTTLEHPFRTTMLDNLSQLFHSRFRRLGAMDDLAKAVQASEEAVATTPADHPQRATMLKDLSNWYHSRYSSLGELGDLEKGIEASEEAITATPLDHADFANRLFLLALLLRSRFKRLGDATDSYRCLNLCIDAWSCRIAAPQIRIRAVCLAAGQLAGVGMWKELSPLLEDAVKLLPSVSPQYLGRGDHEHILSEFSDLTGIAISAALQVGSEPYHCLSLLEIGRGIIMGFAIDCRSDLSELKAKNPDDFETLSRLRAEIDSPMVRETKHTPDDDRRRRRVQAFEEIDQTLVHIRQIPGFERFQLPPSSEELTAMATEGPIVIFNCTTVRSDAIIVTSVVKALMLPNMVFPEVRERMGQLARVVRGKRSTYASRNREMEEVLIWLWKVAVEPVFQELGFEAVKDSRKLPRVWWIGVGPLARAPFHAAGHHYPHSTSNTISCAISSYIPTIKALSYARQKKLELRGPDSRLLLVSMPTTPDTPAMPEIFARPGIPAIPGTPPIPATSTTPAIPRTHGIPAVYSTIGTPGAPAIRWKSLQNATTEVNEIVSAVKRGSSVSTTELHSPTAAEVIEALPTHNAIHFACHGVSDGQNPSNSHLLLYGNSGPAKLTVGMISNMNIDIAQVAYLSACSTADNASTALADESIHIASGFQLAGFSHVLATLWESNDGACREVAGEFYRLLYREGGEQDHRAVGSAFHFAVDRLRIEMLRQPIMWASFIHTGA